MVDISGSIFSRTPSKSYRTRLHGDSFGKLTGDFSLLIDVDIYYIGIYCFDKNLHNFLFTGLLDTPKHSTVGAAVLGEIFLKPN